MSTTAGNGRSSRPGPDVIGSGQIGEMAKSTVSDSTATSSAGMPPNVTATDGASSGTGNTPARGSPGTLKPEP